MVLCDVQSYGQSVELLTKQGFNAQQGTSTGAVNHGGQLQALPGKGLGLWHGRVPGKVPASVQRQVTYAVYIHME